MSLYANVLVPPLEQELTYRIPDDMVGELHIGSKVTVPLGRRFASAFVAAIKEEIDLEAFSAFQIKDIEKVLGTVPCFTEEQLEFFKWISSYYSEPLSSIIDLAVPNLAAPKHDHYIQLNENVDIGSLKGASQKALIELLQNYQNGISLSELKTKIKIGSTTIKGLQAKGLITVISNEIVDNKTSTDDSDISWAKKTITLSEEQQKALDEIKNAIKLKHFKPFLLHGITGSGKTEVYIEAIKKVLDQGKGALLIVPEIALTPQVLDRFKVRFGNKIAVLHSDLTVREKWNYWRSLIEGRCFLAIGARSALFAPIKNLGLIIVDEEHDNSYKQSDGIRYNARDLAIVRAKLNDCPVVLGSATPSLESFYNAVKKKYSYLELKQRPEKSVPPTIELVNLGTVKLKEMKGNYLSPQLHTAIAENLEKNEHTFILYNRRGFATFLRCPSCATSVSCPHCSVTLTYYQKKNTLLCHYCNFRMVPPLLCPSCSTAKDFDEGNKESVKLVQYGAGTERIYDELKELFPDANIARLDRDVVDNMHSYRQILGDMRAGKTDILVGTQMIAKGHDLPNVTLVGVLDCDIGLHLPDFRAAERTYQLLTQVSGRSGRGEKGGRVILQTRKPMHPSVFFTAGSNYYAFAKHELKNREELSYPPYGKLLRVVASSVDPTAPREFLERAFTKLEEMPASEGFDKVRVLGPTPAPLEKIKTRWRWHLLLKSPTVNPLIFVTKYLKGILPKKSNIRLSFDLDPQDML